MKSLKSDINLILKGLSEIKTIRGGLIALTVIKSIFTALSPFVNIYMSAAIISSLAQKQPFAKAVYLAVITVSLNLLVALITSALNHIMNIRQEEFDARYDMKLNQKSMSLDYIAVEDPKTHQLLEKINTFRSMTGGGLRRLLVSFQELITNLFTVIFSVTLTASLFTSFSSDGEGIAGFISSPWFSLILIAAIFLNIIISMYSNVTVTDKMYAIMNDFIPFNRIFGYYLSEYISSYHAGKDIRIYNQKELIKSESMALLDDAYGVIDKISRNQIKYSAMITVSTVTLSALTYLFVGLKALAGFFAVGAIVQYIGSISQFTTGFTGFVTEFAVLRSNNEALRIYFAFMELPNEMQMGSRQIHKKDMNEYEIEFRNVSFRYPGSETYALKNLNLKFHIGKRMAIVGMNGSGKTTMVKLLCRLYDPTEGEITLNGTDIKEYDYKEYMELFSVVFQDFTLFPFSLGQNVSADMEYNGQEASDCLEKAGFSERIKRMPRGLDTALYKDFEEDGIEISGGEAQKIALARALYKDAPIFILDEPTAALDPIAEYEIYSRFNEIVGDKTTIYISHRLSSCRFCDEIAVIHNGSLIQRGSHEELVADRDGKYYEMWNAQAQYYSE